MKLKVLEAFRRAFCKDKEDDDTYSSHCNCYKGSRFDKDYKIFKCPSCKQKLRVPRGKGKIKITCRRCSFEFIKKT